MTDTYNLFHIISIKSYKLKNIFPYLCTCNGSLMPTGWLWWKGNQVRILNRPAAVSSTSPQPSPWGEGERGKRIEQHFCHCFKRQQTADNSEQILSVVRCLATIVKDSGRRSKYGSKSEDLPCDCCFLNIFLIEENSENV